MSRFVVRRCGAVARFLPLDASALHKWVPPRRRDILDGLHSGAHVVVDRYAHSGVAFSSGGCRQRRALAAGTRRAQSPSHAPPMLPPLALLQPKPAWTCRGAKRQTPASPPPTSSSSWISLRPRRRSAAGSATSGEAARRYRRPRVDQSDGQTAGLAGGPLPTPILIPRSLARCRRTAGTKQRSFRNACGSGSLPCTRGRRQSAVLSGW